MPRGKPPEHEVASPHGERERRQVHEWASLTPLAQLPAAAQALGEVVIERAARRLVGRDDPRREALAEMQLRREVLRRVANCRALEVENTGDPALACAMGSCSGSATTSIYTQLNAQREKRFKCVM